MHTHFFITFRTPKCCTMLSYIAKYIYMKIDCYHKIQGKNVEGIQQAPCPVTRPDNIISAANNKMLGLAIGCLIPRSWVRSHMVCCTLITKLASDSREVIVQKDKKLLLFKFCKAISKLLGTLKHINGTQLKTNIGINNYETTCTIEKCGEKYCAWYLVIMKQLDVEVSPPVNDSQTCNLQSHNLQRLTGRLAPHIYSQSTKVLAMSHVTFDLDPHDLRLPGHMPNTPFKICKNPPLGCALALAKGNLWLSSGPMVRQNCHGITTPTHPSPVKSSFSL